MSSSKPAARPLFAYFAHHKCASSWVNRHLWNLCADLGLKFRSFNSDEQFSHDLAGSIRKLGLDFVSLRNARQDHLETLRAMGPLKGVHVIRDPRDILVSAYFSHLKTHKLFNEEMAQERERLQALPKEEGLIAEMDGITHRTLQEMNQWDSSSSNEDILELKMEELTVNDREEFPKLVEFLGLLSDEDDSLGFRIKRVFNQLHAHSKGKTLLRLPMDRIVRKGLERNIERLSFRNLSGGRKPGQTNENSHYRKGKAGDWRNHFTDEVKAEFKKRFPGIVSRLGYEGDENW